MNIYPILRLLSWKRVAGMVRTRPLSADSRSDDSKPARPVIHKLLDSVPVFFDFTDPSGNPLSDQHPVYEHYLRYD